MQKATQNHLARFPGKRTKAELVLRGTIDTTVAALLFAILRYIANAHKPFSEFGQGNQFTVPGTDEAIQRLIFLNDSADPTAKAGLTAGLLLIFLGGVSREGAFTAVSTRI